MTELEILKRAEAYTFELMDRDDRMNEDFRKAYGYDNSVCMDRINSYWDDILEIWGKIRELENIDK